MPFSCTGIQLSEKVCVACRIAFSNIDKDTSEVNRGLDHLVEYSGKYNDVELNTYLPSNLT